ncbi:TIGR01777 family oxidoreductase [Hoyosella rhizosphaerae]|uniref:Nucleoside-diphosphate sugar epimerase n=1 Tax=Hoyosella rhizosphaerae TaxID=1755582 RepID=A0A916U244_9ACTN|nr:TIGR01777 family oxidoreductase [Hoyosella rhizosphaerae]MBN4926636.1 TIGR01777 family oxidoreductase [Hoyosella rhizosphaerae]GGC57652.1 nucleoside-diphosphate sugar epimerase [Hoyosella rhizosphaerae]
MGIEYTTFVDDDIDSVFAWHGRPGAFRRLVPPWQPMKLVSEASSLSDGTAVLGLPGGLRWIAKHDPEAYDPPYRFADELSRDGAASIPANLAVSWRHTHTFSSAGTGLTKIVDRVETTVPEFALRSTFQYRERQLHDDFARHREYPGVTRTIAITGASGLVGTALSAFLSTGGHRVIRLVRGESNGPDERTWDPQNPSKDLFDDVDAVIHLAGSSIAGRFTEEHKQKILDSRIGPTRLLATCAAQASNGPEVFVSASAVGFYGSDRGDEVLNEDASPGDGFLADVVAQWEDATQPARESGLRVVNVRTGIVQSPNGGTLQMLRPLFSAGLGGKLGSGRQWLSWIDLDDLVDIYHRAVLNTTISGPVNAVAPLPVRNIEYTKALGAVLRRPTILPVPSFGPKLLLGKEGTEELAMASQNVLPYKLLDGGHNFRRPSIVECLRHQFGKFV